jgi:hypothetical protein
VVRAIATSGGPASATIGGTWSATDVTQPLTAALVDSLIAGKIYVNFHTTANGGGEIRGQVKAGTGIITSVKQPSEAVPTSFKLEQNYPNPFNPSTTIKFELAHTARVSLKVYNLLGELVATIFDNELKATGSYQVSFEASSLPTGVYFYKLTTNTGFVETRKMLLLQ